MKAFLSVFINQERKDLYKPLNFGLIFSFKKRFLIDLSSNQKFFLLT